MESERREDPVWFLLMPRLGKTDIKARNVIVGLNIGWVPFPYKITWKVKRERIAFEFGVRTA